MTTSNQQDNRELSQLIGPLPFHYQSIKILESHRPKGFRFHNHSIIIDAQFKEVSIISCGEDSELMAAIAKARSELIERTALANLPSLEWNLNKTGIPIKCNTSNGWAAHPQKNKAEIGAVLELLERDAVMAQWYKESPFLELEIALAPEPFPLKVINWANTELAQSEFPILRILLSTEGLGASITCLLLNNQGFGVCGHSTKLQLEDAVDNAIGEACRAAQFTLRKSFWRDSLSLKENSYDAKINPGAHGVYYAYHEAFPKWMFGNQISWNLALTLWNKSISRILNTYFDEFNLITQYHAPLFVSCARHPKALVLTWGNTDQKRIEELRSNERLKGVTINTKPHIIS